MSKQLYQSKNFEHFLHHVAVGSAAHGVGDDLAVEQVQDWRKVQYKRYILEDQEYIDEMDQRKKPKEKKSRGKKDKNDLMPKTTTSTHTSEIDGSN